MACGTTSATNKQPEKRAELRLVVNAGSVLEDDDQQGLAHFVEHMAFNGTKHFPKQDVVKFMESIGMRFGPHVNAYTSFDETVYMLQVPTDKADVLDQAFLILEDWAHGADVRYQPRSTRSAASSWRSGGWAAAPDARMRDKQFPVLLKGSRYAERLPIGKPEILQNFKHDRLKKFYTDWYRPDLMAVVAVGDFDKAAVESADQAALRIDPGGEVAEAAADVRRAAASRHALHDCERQGSRRRRVGRHLQPVPGARPDHGRRVSSADGGGTVQRACCPRASARWRRSRTRRSSAPAPAAAPSSARTKRRRSAPSRRKTGSSAGSRRCSPKRSASRSSASPPRELERQKIGMLRSIERAVAEKDKQESGRWPAKYIRNFLAA